MTHLPDGTPRTPSKLESDPQRPPLHYPLGLFQGYGIELEYMIVDRETLDVRPVADRLLADAGGEGASEVEFDEIAWSNELTAHVLELKSNGPAPHLEGLAQQFQAHFEQATERLRALDALLLPTSMHPWMDPARETVLWPHAQTEIYRAYDRIFGVRGHGWANVQSVHINLPFADEAEFVHLHAAVRVILPLLPGLAASSPIHDGRASGLHDSRLMAYLLTQQRVPSVTGRGIPEAVRTVNAYHERILGRMYREIAPLDPEGILQHEWLNSRGAIARFDRGAIEIRLLDIQESPRADLAVVALVTAAVRALTEERWVELDRLHRVEGELLERMLLAGIRDAGGATIWSRDYLALFGIAGRDRMTMSELWQRLADTLIDGARARSAGWDDWYTVYREHGTLSRRILRAAGPHPDRGRLAAVYRQLARCLAEGGLFTG